MDITSTMRFDIFGTSNVYGVYFFDTASESVENINGVFEIKVRGDGIKHAFGICFDNSSEGNLIVNGE
jgi:hypothetical protein